MDLLLCGASAFRYWRTPPQILALYPPLPQLFEDSNHRKLASCDLVQDILGAPLYRAAFAPGQNSSTKLYVTQTFKNGLPPSSVQNTEHGFTITSPAATLLTMAKNISQEHLLLVLYEMLGAFTVFNPCKRAERVLEAALTQGFLRPTEGWHRVKNVDGHGTDLWKRSPLVTIEELEVFCEHAAGFHGVKKLRWAIEHVSGCTASPFEGQTSTLLSLPRAAGGEGMVIKNNQRIPLSPAARSIYPHEACFADILIESRGDNAGVVLECQGRSVHASEAAGILDSNRTTALNTMGYEVILVTYDQIANRRSFQAVLDIIARKTGVRRRAKTPRQLQAEEALRREIFIDWNTLGS